MIGRKAGGEGGKSTWQAQLVKFHLCPKHKCRTLGILIFFLTPMRGRGGIKSAAGLKVFSYKSGSFQWYKISFNLNFVPYIWIQRHILAGYLNVGTKYLNLDTNILIFGANISKSCLFEVKMGVWGSPEVLSKNVPPTPCQEFSQKTGDSPIKSNMKLGPQRHPDAESLSEGTIQLFSKPWKMMIIIPRCRRGTWKGVTVATWCSEWICRMQAGPVQHFSCCVISPDVVMCWKGRAPTIF